MTDRPILFSGAMVRALLAGTKTQTRRVLNTGAIAQSSLDCAEAPRLAPKDYYPNQDGRLWQFRAGRFNVYSKPFNVKFAVGDRLWVRENVTRFDKGTCDQHIWFAAGRNEIYPWLDKHFPGLDPDAPWPHPEGPGGGPPYSVPSIHMPRWASRLTLAVTDVRVQRLQEITHVDSAAEGCLGVGTYPNDYEVTPRDQYRALWDSLNADRAGGAYQWVANPWVVAVTFTVLRQNIDEAA